MLSTRYQFTMRELLALPALLVAGVGVNWSVDDLSHRLIMLLEGDRSWFIAIIRSPWFALIRREWQGQAALVLVDVPGIVGLALITFSLGCLQHRWAAITCICLVVCNPVADFIELGSDLYVRSRGWLSIGLLLVPIASWFAGQFVARRWRSPKAQNWLAALLAVFLIALSCYGHYLHLTGNL